MSTPTVAPTRFAQGLTVKWIVSLADYSPDDGWALTYYFTRATDHRSSAAADAGDGTWLVTITAEQSALFTTGDYWFEARVAKGDEVFRVDEGTVTVEAAPSAAADRRSHAKKMLDLIDALLESRITRAQVAGYSVSTPNGSRSMQFASLAELREARTYYRRLYRQEVDAVRRAQGKKSSTTIRAKFV